MNSILKFKECIHLPNEFVYWGNEYRLINAIHYYYKINKYIPITSHEGIEGELLAVSELVRLIFYHSLTGTYCFFKCIYLPIPNGLNLLKFV